MQRSGTTLFDKLLASHPRLSVLSQPFPLLFVEAKRSFLRTLGDGDALYPLGDLFLESRYRPEDLAAYLAAQSFDGTALAPIFAMMDGFPGQYTPFDPERLAQVLESLEPSDLAGVAARLYRAFAHRPEAVLYGGKETTCEELLPHLLDRGFRCLLVLRDPRDVLASLAHGEGRRHGGRLKPTLFNLRQWRKSVAFALHLEEHPRFLWLRYEDLVIHRPDETLDRVARFLGIEPFPEAVLSGGLRDQSGRAWTGNSSHGARSSLDASSVGTYRDLLPPAVVRYAEAACGPEMRWLGYEASVRMDEATKILRSFADPYGGERPELAAYEPAACAGAELKRLTRLAEPASSGSRPWFLFEDVHDRLRGAFLPA
jgi:hypothetical protein